MAGLLTGWADAAVSGAIGDYFTSRQTARNYALNEQAAENADRRQRQQYHDMYSISAQMRELKAAGLSPSLMYGDIPGVQGASGAQGNGGSGLSAMFAPAEGMLGAQIAQAEAETRKTNAEADTIEGKNSRGAQEIKQIITKTNNLFLEGENQALQNSLLSMDVSLKGEYGEAEVKAKVDTMVQNLENLRTTLRSLQAHAKIDENSADAIIAYYRQRVIEQQAQIALTCMQTELTKNNISLTQAQVEKLFNDILVDNANIEISRRNVTIKENELNAQIAQWAEENGLRKRGQNIEIAKTFADIFMNSYMTIYSNNTRLLESCLPFKNKK